MAEAPLRHRKGFSTIMLSSHDSEQAFQNLKNTAFFEAPSVGKIEEAEEVQAQYLASRSAEKKARDPVTPVPSASGPPSAVVVAARASSTNGGRFAKDEEKEAKTRP